jgi:predicted MFS family arabinose efflux permease
MTSHAHPHDAARLRVLMAGLSSLILVLGIARFAYTPLLPLMQQQAGLGVAEAGWLAAVNYAGYLSGAILAASISDLVLKDQLYRAGMVLAVLSTAMMALSSDWRVWALSRFLAGLSSAAGMLLGTGLILNWLIRHQYRSELGLHFSGIGIGMAGCAAAVLAMTAVPFDWQQQWWAFSAIAVLLMVPALRWLPPPDTSGLTVGGQAMTDQPPSPLFLRVFMAAYFCAGIGFVVSVTFIVAIVDRLPGLQGRGAWVFLVMGLTAAPAVIVWDRIARRLGDIDALILCSALHIVGIVLPIGGTLAAAMAGAVLFGATFIGLVSLVLSMAGRYYPTRPAKMMGRMTLTYGCAQILGPAATGWLAARSGGSYVAGLSMAAAVMGVGLLLMCALRVIARRA